MDILTADIKWPTTFFIVGSGPNLVHGLASLPFIHRRDTGACTIAVNAAICVCTPDYWLVSDINVRKYEWFTQKLSTAYERGVTMIFGPQYPPGTGDYTFTEGMCINYDRVALVPGKLCMGATVSGIAFQLAMQVGAKHIYLLGVDMFGRDHITGEKNPAGVNEGAWNCVHRFNALIHLAQAQGVVVQSLTETKLDVKVI